MARFRIGEVTLLAELGAGAGSRVFHVRRRADGVEYALKVVPAGCGTDPRYVEQAEHEFRVGQILDHPNVAKVHAFEVRRDWLLRPTTARLLVEFVHGRALHKQPLGLGRALRVFERVAAALAHMHGRGVFHADLKPDNLIYDPETGVKVIDLGLAWLVGEPKGRVQGTPEYMAPETAAHKFINERTDIYNLGATMYRIITRRALPPRPLDGIFAAPGQAVHVAPVASLNPGAPPELCDLIHRCLCPDPGGRPGSADDLRARLNRLTRSQESAGG